MKRASINCQHCQLPLKMHLQIGFGESITRERSIHPCLGFEFIARKRGHIVLRLLECGCRIVAHADFTPDEDLIDQALRPPSCAPRDQDSADRR